MDYEVKSQKLFYRPTKKYQKVAAMKLLVLVMGMIITYILVIQSSSLTRPYGYNLSSLYSTCGKVLKPGMTSLSVEEDVSCRTDLVGFYPSVSLESFVTNTDYLSVEKEIMHGDELPNEKATGGDSDFDFHADQRDWTDGRFPPSPSPSPTQGMELDELESTNKEEQVEYGELSKNDNDLGSKEVSEFSVLQGGPATRTKYTETQIKSEITPASLVTSIHEMSNLLVRSHSTFRSMQPRWSSPRDRELLTARSDIENAPIVDKDTDLYASLFRNISTFKRSYELMERMLKVYVYKEGTKPIFHSPRLKGIYASEGWFMRQLEGNKRFVVNDPTEAHLFYLPFSSRALQGIMHVPISHGLKNLSEYLKNYLDTIAARHPFWNRTGGADHFLAACHDWAPEETNDYMSTCIRALCNADVNVGFKIGKDVSLPETNIHSSKYPLRYLGGEPPLHRRILAFFAGRMHGYLRQILVKHWENKDPDMHVYGGGNMNQKSYIHSMKSSKYCICARGYEVNSPRVVESIFFECVPVIISDNFVPPFFEVLNWEAFAVFVPEKDIPNLKSILLSITEDKYVAMQMNVKKVRQHFLWHTSPLRYDVFHMILHSIWYNRVFQIPDR
ncbi:hypothetical protein C5167_047768 [Papaver somniferum]|uniref:Exostosin GT47 domain-containing protein n=1 Tax=Papaver somniferum TaxID=3469 RepID=A0A4Y7LHL0_PAPSO|nr:probable glycosyltransferase At3g07620 [Papaver somniferum]RZC84984.1 hypothetical protein C5167_047768 [Papaver somniferum]